MEHIFYNALSKGIQNMMITSSIQTRYDKFTRLLHWIIAIGIIYASIVGYSLHFITNPSVFTFFSELNMALATVVTVLMVIRFIWRFFRKSVPYDDHFSRAKKGFVVLMHEVFYLIIFVVLISGFLMLKNHYSFFGLFDIPQPIVNEPVNEFFFQVHRVGCASLAIMLLLHVAAVIKHQVIDKNAILSRML